MSEMSRRSRLTPEGWHTVTPRIVVYGAERLVEFVKHVFEATGDYRPDRPAVLTIGDSMFNDKRRGSPRLNACLLVRLRGRRGRDL